MCQLIDEQVQHKCPLRRPELRSHGHCPRRCRRCCSQPHQTCSGWPQYKMNDLLWPPVSLEIIINISAPEKPVCSCFCYNFVWRGSSKSSKWLHVTSKKWLLDKLIDCCLAGAAKMYLYHRRPRWHHPYCKSEISLYDLIHRRWIIENGLAVVLTQKLTS